ncbi:MAG: mechanosensitive ion channel family protein, partial [Phycisphaeraceae bacterium]
PRTGERLRQRGWEMRAIAFDDAASPASLTCLTVALMVGMGAFVYIEPDTALETFVRGVVTLLYVIALGWFLFNLVDLIDVALRRVVQQRDSAMGEMVVGLVRKSLRIVLVIMFTLGVADNVFGVNIGAWLAGFGIAGLAVSLAAQDSIRNLFGSLTIFFDKPFKVGDLITFNGTTGTVAEIGFRSTKQRMFTGAMVTIPNMKFIDGSVENISSRLNIRRLMNLTITYDTPPAKVEQAVQILKDILHDEQVAAPFDMEETPPRVVFTEYNADSLNIMVIYWYLLDADKGQDWWGYNAHAEDVNLRILTAFEQAGIDFAFPTRTLYLAGDRKRELAVRMLSQDEKPHTNTDEHR